MKTFAASALLLALSAPALANDPAAMTVTRDPETGELRAPTAQERAELEAAARRDEQLEKAGRGYTRPGKIGRAPMDFAEPPATAEEAEKTLQFREDGIGVMRAPKSSYSRVVATRGEDGRIEIKHQDASEELPNE